MSDKIDQSDFFNLGYYQKASPCPKVFTIVKEGDEICNHKISKTENGSSKFDAKKSLSICISNTTPYIVETKFNGNRGIFEYRDQKSGIFTSKQRLDKVFPNGISSLFSEYIKGNLKEKPSIDIKSAVLDGEIFLKKCKKGNKWIVPELGLQSQAIKGDHPELVDSCQFSYQVFDVIQLNGKHVSDLPIEKRKEILRKILPNPVVGGMTRNGIIDTAKNNLIIDPIFGKKLTGIASITDEYCKKIDEGQEGLVIKSLGSTYVWKGQKDSYRANWFKIKEEFDIDASIMKACLGELKGTTKTNQHLLRYKDLKMYICETDDCNKMMDVGTSGSASDGSSINGWDGWDTEIHYPLLELLRNGIAKPSRGSKFRTLDSINAQITNGKLKSVNTQQKMKELLGCSSNRGCYMDSNGNIALPECIDIPKNKIIVEAITTEINMENGKPHLGGPPRIVRIRTDKKIPNNLEYLNKLYGVEIHE